MRIGKSTIGVGLSYKVLARHHDPLRTAHYLDQHRDDKPKPLPRLSSPRMTAWGHHEHPAVVMPKGYKQRITLAKVWR